MPKLDINQFTVREELVLDVLVNNGIAEHQVIGEALEEAGWSGSLESIRLCVFNIRIKLEPISVEVRNRRGAGWYIPETHKTRLLNSITSE